jgi:hypothetical protein
MPKLTAAFSFVAAAAAGGCLLLSLSCSMAANPTELYERGLKEARAAQWEPATGDLEAFTGRACEGSRRDKRCRQAYFTLGRAYQQRGSVARAWVAFDTALAFPSTGEEDAAGTERAAVEQQVRDRQSAAAGRGPVMVRYRDEMTDEFTARYVLVSIDFSPVHARNKGAGDLRSPDFTQLWAGSLPAGDHVLVVEAAHTCKPGTAGQCAASQVRRSWSFSSEAHTPTGLDIRAFAEAGPGDGPARPALEMRPH